MKDTTRDSRNEKMRETYQFIERYIDRNGYSPTVREVRLGLNLSSTSVANARIERLAQHGWIVRTPGIARSIRLTRGKKVTV